MITVSDLGLAYSGQPLFSHVDLQFTKGNCYGIIGANGAGKSTFLKILSGELEPTSGEVSILPKTRMSVLKQDQNAYNAYNVMDTVIMGNQRLYDIGKEKEALYAKEEMTEADGIRACELEEEYAELGGWEAESDASRILQGLGVGTEFHSNDGSIPAGPEYRWGPAPGISPIPLLSSGISCNSIFIQLVTFPLPDDGFPHHPSFPVQEIPVSIYFVPLIPQNPAAGAGIIPRSAPVYPAPGQHPSAFVQTIGVNPYIDPAVGVRSHINQIPATQPEAVPRLNIRKALPILIKIAPLAVHMTPAAPDHGPVVAQIILFLTIAEPAVI